MDPLIEQITFNLDEIAKKYEAGEKATKLKEYILSCRDKLRSKGRLDLVVELNQAISQRLEYAKEKTQQEEQARRGYLRGLSQPVHAADDSRGGEGDELSAQSAQGGRLPFREDAF